MIIDVERVTFKRPNSDKEELGLMIGEFGRHIIIDNDMNIVINCYLERLEGRGWKVNRGI